MTDKIDPPAGDSLPTPSSDTVNGNNVTDLTTDSSDSEGEVEDIPFRDPDQAGPNNSKHTSNANRLSPPPERFGARLNGGVITNSASIMRRMLPIIFDGLDIPRANPLTPTWTGKVGNIDYNEIVQTRSVDEPVDHDFGLPPAPPNSPEPKPRRARKILTNEQFACLAGPIPPPPEFKDPENRLHLKQIITNNLGGVENRKTLEEARLTHTVQLAVVVDGNGSSGNAQRFIAGLSEIDTFVKLKTILCQRVGHMLLGFMQTDAVACIYKTEVSFVGKNATFNGVRLFVGESGKPENADFDRLYENQTTHLKSELAFPILDCPCGTCDGAKKLPEICVRIKVVHHGEQKGRPRRKQRDDKIRRKAVAGINEANLIHFEDLVSDREERDALVKHDDTQYPRILMHAGVARHILDENAQAIEKLKAYEQKIEALQTENTKLKGERGVRRSRVINSSSSSSDIKPPTKKHKKGGKAAVVGKNGKKMKAGSARVTNIEDDSSDMTATESEDEKNDGKSSDGDYEGGLDFGGVSEADRVAILKAMGEGGCTRSLRAR